MENTAYAPQRRTPTIDEVVDNTIASMELEGQPLTETERIEVRERALRELGPKLKANPGPA